MTGWRMGYAAASADIVHAMEAYQSHATSGPNSIAQYASYKALQNGVEYIRAMREEYDARRKIKRGKCRRGKFPRRPGSSSIHQPSMAIYFFSST